MIKDLDKIFFQIDLDYRKRRKLYRDNGDFDLVERNERDYKKAVKKLKELFGEETSY